MKCIIVDDERASRAVLMQLCKQVPDLEVEDAFDNCMGALKYINDNAVDIIFLDLHIDVFSGFDLLKTISADQKVVLITSDKEFALKSYEYENVIDYLVKPVTRERFDKAIDKVRRQFVLDQFGPDTHSEEDLLEGGDPTKSLRKSLYINIDRRLINLRF